MKKALNQIWNMLKNIILFLLAKFIMLEAFLIGLVYSLFKAFYKRQIGMSLQIIAEYFFNAAYVIDILGNVLLGPLWTDLFCKNKSIKKLKFGNRKKTISQQLGDNQWFDNLTITGKIMCKILNFIDKNHVEKASSYYKNIN